MPLRKDWNNLQELLVFQSLTIFWCNQRWYFLLQLISVINHNNWVMVLNHEINFYERTFCVVLLTQDFFCFYLFFVETKYRPFQIKLLSFIFIRSNNFNYINKFCLRLLNSFCVAVKFYLTDINLSCPNKHRQRHIYLSHKIETGPRST